MASLTPILSQMLDWLTTIIEFVLDTPLLLIAFAATIAMIIFRLLFSVFRSRA
ncbi:hypothetical protein FACS18949_08960 [Clostridia bacterium]|nr:hypothetical protein FACS18949_08960 [Clostridia bacterium]